jgi:hypothetical protein
MKVSGPRIAQAQGIGPSLEVKPSLHREGWRSDVLMICLPRLGGGRLQSAFANQPLDLLESPSFELPDAFPADAIVLAEFLQRHRIVLQAPLDENVALPLVQGLESLEQ